jgi:hypothetical protein
MPRFTDRYGHQSARQCSTQGCSGTAKNLSGRCHTCSGRLRRRGHALQELPTTAEMDALIRRIEEQIGRLKTLDIEALKARWEDVISECRARAVPTYKDRGVLSYNGHDREGAQLVRDVSEAVTFERVLGIVGAVHLLNLERGYFLSEGIQVFDGGVGPSHVSRGLHGDGHVQCLRDDHQELSKGAEPTITPSRLRVPFGWRRAGCGQAR